MDFLPKYNLIQTKPSIKMIYEDYPFSYSTVYMYTKVKKCLYSISRVDCTGMAGARLSLNCHMNLFLSE